MGLSGRFITNSLSGNSSTKTIVSETNKRGVLKSISVNFQGLGELKIIIDGVTTSITKDTFERLSAGIGDVYNNSKHFSTSIASINKIKESNSDDNEYAGMMILNMPFNNSLKITSKNARYGTIDVNYVIEV